MDEKIEVYRADQFEKLGFTPLQSNVLAVTKDEDGYPLRFDAAFKLLQAGCPADIAFDILS